SEKRGVIVGVCHRCRVEASSAYCITGCLAGWCGAARQKQPVANCWMKGWSVSYCRNSRVDWEYRGRDCQQYGDCCKYGEGFLQRNLQLSTACSWYISGDASF